MDIIVTYRQKKILELLAASKRDAEIATAIGYCDRTVKSDISMMYHSIGGSTRTGLVAAALRAGVIK